MDFEVQPFDPFPTAPRGPWCDRTTRFTHYGPVAYRPPPSAAWSTPRSHRCGAGCFAADVDVASLTSLSDAVAIYVEIEQSKPVAAAAPRRNARPKARPVLDIREARPSRKPKFALTPPSPSTKTPFAFNASPPLRPTAKRARPAADVDGPNTATLSSKKRRLRLELITSRLSQPFSLPATHILNREALAAGDKRFLKMSAHAEVVRRGGESAASFRRFALLNRTRECLRGCNWTDLGGYLACPVPVDKGRPTTPVPGRAQGTRPVKGVTKPVSPPKLHLPTPPGSRQAKVSSPPSPLRRAEPSERDGDVERRSIYDDEDDCEAFPDSLYDEEEDSGDVYSDFGAIFDSGGSGEEDAHSFEDYLDELDGISWAVR